MNKKSILCFDFDGTLANSASLEFHSMLKTVQDFGHEEIQGNDLLSYYGPTEPGIIEKIVGEDEFPAALPYFFRTYSELQETLLTPNQQIINMLLQLKKHQGVRLVLVTGRSLETLEISLHYLGMEDIFEKVYTGSKDGINKQDSMDQVAEDFDVNKEDMVYIGDTVEDVNVMRENGYDIISAAYFHDIEYQDHLEKLNPQLTMRSIDALNNIISEII